MKRLACGGFLLFGIGLLAHPLAAQFTDYRPPGKGVEELAPADRKGQIDDAIENARWKLGALHVQPWAGIRDIVFTTGGRQGEEEDLGVSFGAGLLAFLRLGSKFALTGQATPEYVWWRENRGRQERHERFAADLYGFLNRLQIHFAATRLDALEIVSPEAIRYISRRHDGLEGNLELRVGSAMHLFVEARTRELRLLEDLPEFSTFANHDRDDTFVTTGVRFRRLDKLSFELGLEDASSEFGQDTANRSNQGTYPFLGLTLNRSRFLVRARIAARSLEPTSGSTFAHYDEPAGEVGVLWRLGRRTQLDSLLSRDLSYSVEPSISSFQSDRLEVRLRFDVLRRSTISIFSQLGRDDFFASVSGALARSQDVVAIGSLLSIPVGDTVDLTLGYFVIDFDSKVDELDRRTGQFHLRITTSSFPDVFSMR